MGRALVTEHGEHAEKNGRLMEGERDMRRDGRRLGARPFAAGRRWRVCFELTAGIPYVETQERFRCVMARLSHILVDDALQNAIALPREAGGFGIAHHAEHETGDDTEHA